MQTTLTAKRKSSRDLVHSRATCAVSVWENRCLCVVAVVILTKGTFSGDKCYVKECTLYAQGGNSYHRYNISVCVCVCASCLSNIG